MRPNDAKLNKLFHKFGLHSIKGVIEKECCEKKSAVKEYCENSTLLS